MQIYRNYRPIRSLSAISKNEEIVVHQQMADYSIKYSYLLQKYMFFFDIFGAVKQAGWNCSLF